MLQARILWVILPATLVGLPSGCKSAPGGGQVAQTGTAAVSPLDFGKLPVGDSLSETLAMQAYLQNVTLIGPLQIQGANASDFTVVTPPTTTVLTTDKVTTAVVAFHPTAPGSRTASLVATYDPYGGTQGDGGTGATTTVSLTGIGVAASDISLEVTPTSLDFKEWQIGGFDTQNVTVKNLNPFRITVVLGSADGGFDGGEFSVPTPGPTLDKNQQVAVPVTFVPTQLGMATASLPIAACEACPVQNVALTGTGVNASLAFMPEAVNFGFVLDGTFAPPMPVTVTVQGNTAVTINSVGLLQNRSTVFGVTNINPPLPQTFTADGGQNTLTFDVTYTPSHFPGGDYDVVVVDYKLGQSPTSDPARLIVTGNVLPDGGCNLVVEPAGKFDFGTLIPGQQVTKSLQMINAGANDCVLTSVQLAAGSDPAFTIGQGLADGGGTKTLDGGLVILAHAELQGFGQPGLPITFGAPHDSPRYHRSATLTFSYTAPAPRTGQVLLTGTLASAYSALSPWPRWAHDNANTGQGEIDTSGSDGGLLWSLSLSNAGTQGLGDCALQQNGYYSNGPIVGDNRLLYVVGCDGTFYAVDELGGSVAWKKQLQAPAPGTYTTPALAPDDVIDVAYGSVSGPNYTADVSYDAGIVVLATLEQLGGTCGIPVPYPSNWPPNLPPTLYYDPLMNYYQIAASSRALISLQNQDLCLAGAQISWSAPVLSLGGSLYSVVSGPMVYLFPPQAAVGDFSETVLPFASGTLPSAQVSSPALGDDGTSYWCSKGTCVAMNVAGNELWSQTLGPVTVDYSNDYGAPVLGNGQLYALAVGRSLSSFSSQLLSLDPTSGAANWTYTLPGATVSTTESTPTPWGLIATPALTADNLLVVPNADGVYAIYAAGQNRGQLAWKLLITGGSFAPPAIGADGTIYLGTVSQGLLAIDPLTHAIRWSFVPKNADGSTASISGSPAIGEFGIFVTADNGFLYGIH
jgi:outer membrane protein assembly factor BamB